MSEEILIINSGSNLLKAVFDLRHKVFVVEQNVPANLEIDEHDQSATHLIMLQDAAVIATLRLVPYGDKAKIGRVAVTQQQRRKGLGTKLMLRGIRHADESGFREVMLDSQVASMPFYQSLGFVEEGGVFDDAGIPHMRMRLSLR